MSFFIEATRTSLPTLARKAGAKAKREIFIWFPAIGLLFTELAGGRGSTLPRFEVRRLDGDARRMRSPARVICSGRCNSGTIAGSLLAAMRKVSQFKLIVKTAPELLEEEVNLFLQKQGYELHGSPFGSAECFGQALVKYEQAHPTGLPSTLQSHG